MYLAIGMDPDARFIISSFSINKVIQLHQCFRIVEQQPYKVIRMIYYKWIQYRLNLGIIHNNLC
jgi:hypothetical protein